MGNEGPFADLRKLADWFATLPSGADRPRATSIVERIVHRLGATSVPLLGRELCVPGPGGARRRDAARAALGHLATGEARSRVIAELRRIAASDAADDGKVCAVGLLAELGERGSARFADPSTIQQRSAVALATQLDTAADVAAAADLMVRQLADDDLVRLLAVMVDAAPAPAHRLGAELCGRLDLAGELRDRISELAELGASVEAEPSHGRAPRPTRALVLVDAAARLVIVASRKLGGERRWRRWAVLIGAEGRIDDCIHEDRADQAGEDAPLVASLVADGYRIASTELERARTIVLAAARREATLPSAYYLGRDLLDLGLAHLGGAPATHPSRQISTTLGRAIELIADDEPARAEALLARCRASADVAAASAACAFAQGHPADAALHLARAIDAEPEWPLHHWNLAAACHQLGDVRASYHALRRFVATSAASAGSRSGLRADPAQPGRVALALRVIAELERTARLTGTPLAVPRRRRRTARRQP